MHRVGKAASLPNDGNCSISEAVHLVQATWLVLRRHKEDVRTSLNQVGTAIIEFESHAGFAWIPVDDGPQVAFGFFIAASEQSKVDIFREQVIQNSNDEIEPFLTFDAGYHREHRPVQTRGLQRELLQQSLLVFQ